MKKSGNASMMISHPGNNESVRVISHMRKRPVKNATGPARTAQIVTDDLAENSKMSEMPDRGVLNGLRGPGQSEINHLSAAVGLLNRRRV